MDNPLSVSVRDDGKKRLVLDLRHVNPHLYKYKFKCGEVAVAPQLPGEGYYTFDIKSAYHHVDIFERHQTYSGFQGQYHGKPTFFLTYCQSVCQQPRIHLPNFQN